MRRHFVIVNDISNVASERELKSFQAGQLSAAGRLLRDCVNSQPSMTTSGETEQNKPDTGWRSLWLSSWALSLSLFGDALIYIVLPVNADLFGISLAWVGVLLAANRIIRTFTYGFVAQLGERIGLKNLCILACCTAILSTAGYGFLHGGWPLLGSRVVWGLSYAGLLLVTFAYAARDRAKTGTRVGVSRAIEQVGPLLALTVGTWLAGIVGPRDVFLYLTVAALITLPMAFILPSKSDDGPPVAPSARPSMFPKPDRFDILIFWMGAGIDGVFTLTIVIMFAQQTSVELAMVSGGLILAARRIAEMVAAPASGAIADKFGVRRPLIASSIFVVAGFVLVGMGWLVSGSLLIVIARGALGTLFPAAVAHFAPAGVLQPLARNQTWRDIGAAAGPLGTGVLLGVFTPEAMHLAIAVIYAISFIWLMMLPIWRRAPE